MQKQIPTYNTLVEYVYHWVQKTPNAIFLRQPEGNNWKTLTYLEAYEEASKMVSALKKLDLKKGDHIAIYSKNCYHWILADLAIMLGGFVSIPLYANLSGTQLKEVLSLADAKGLFIGKLEAWQDETALQLKEVEIIRFPHYKGNAKVGIGKEWEQLVAQNEMQKEHPIPNPTDLWTILFTSGTTGKPKGVMHTHNTPIAIVQDDLRDQTIGVDKMNNYTFFSYLPLNHVGEKIGVHTNAIVLGGTVSFGESISSFVKNLQETQPALFFSVPRI